MQVPLGIAYRNRKNRLGWQLQTGLQWNGLTYKNYQLDITIDAGDETVEIENLSSSFGSTSRKQFISVYAGAGLQYKFSPYWQARANLRYNYNLIHSTQLQNALLDQSLQLGLFYQF